MRRAPFCLSLLLLVLAPLGAAGKKAAPGEAFDGEMVNIRGDGKVLNGLAETGGQMSAGGDGNYLFAVHLGRDARAYLVLVWKPAPGAAMDWKALNDKAVVETWLWTGPLLARVLASPQKFDGKRDFLDVTPAQRRRIEGALPLEGKVHVRRFVSNVNFQVDLDVKTDTDPPRAIKGRFTPAAPDRRARFLPRRCRRRARPRRRASTSATR
jgi:hypothetical protein